MSRTRRRHIVRGISPEGEDHEWSGCGWVEPKRGKRFSMHDADMAAFDANCDGEWTAWREEIADKR